MKILKSFICILLLLCTVHCGGGGGGGGGGRFGVRLLHAVIDAAPFDLFSTNSEEALLTTRFGESKRYIGTDSGEQVLSVRSHNTLENPRFTFELTREGSDRHTVFVFGDNEQFGVGATLIQDEVVELDSSSAAVRILHGAIGAGAVTATVGTQALSATAAFGAASPYEVITGGIQTVAIRRSSDGKVIFSAPLNLENDKQYSLLVAGEVDYFVTTTLIED